jgi:hypothetical protein
MSNLTNEQIKKILDDAPDGATHWDGCYLKVDGINWFVFYASDNEWESVSENEFGVINSVHSLSDLAEILALREWVEALAKHCTNMTNQVSELMQETSRQAMLVNELQAAKIDAVRLLDAALCPCCDKSGAYYDNYGEVQQCQWCYGVEQLKEQGK